LEKEATDLCRAEMDQQQPTEKDPETETQPVPVDGVSVVLPAPGWKKRFISSRRLAAGAEETLTREQTRKWLVMQPLPEEGFLKGTSRDTSVALFTSILSPQPEEAELRWTVATEEGGSNSFSGEREPTIWAQINAENRLRVRQVLNPSCRRRLDLKFESHSTSRDLRDLRLLGDSPPSLWYRNLVKSNARARFHSEYRGKTSSEIAAGFPLFVKTIADLLSACRLKTQTPFLSSKPKSTRLQVLRLGSND
jgi:hypothetical protein